MEHKIYLTYGFAASLFITDKKPNDLTDIIATFDSVPEAEDEAERIRDTDTERDWYPALDRDLANESKYNLSEDDMDIYCW